MKLTFSTPIQAADTERRVISGKIMEYGATGQTSAGPVVFEHGSIEIPSPGRIKLLAQHEPNNPIGRAQSFSADGNFIYGSFKISSSTKGTDYLTLAAEDLVSGLSVGVEVISSLPTDTHLLVTSARLIEVSLVESPAFENAVVTSVAASQAEIEAANSTSTSTKTTTINTTIVEIETETESEDVMTTAPDDTAPEPAAEAPVVDASRPVVSASYMVGEVRSPIKTQAQYLEHKIKATMGNDVSRDYIRAADAIAQKMNFANDSFTTNPAFKPVQYISSVIDTSVMTRPTIDALGGARALAPSGMTISHPKITTAATMSVVAEGAATAGTQIVSAYVDATVVKIAGTQIMSQELLDRSDPSFYSAMYENCLRAYAKASDAKVIAEIIAGGTAAATTQAASVAGLQAFVAECAPLVYAATGETATAFIAGTSVWSTLIGSLDTTGRSIFNAASPMNANGQSTPRGLRGDMMGLDLWVDANMVATTIDNCAFITTPSAICIYESPVLSLSVNITATGEIATELYAYFATKTLIAGGLQLFDKT
jgi:HK97 family phage prohead protease